MHLAMGFSMTIESLIDKDCNMLRTVSLNTACCYNNCNILVVSRMSLILG
jgi:hypothetical protein